MIVQETFHCSPSMGAAAVKAGVAGRRSKPLHLVIADAKDARSTFSTTQAPKHQDEPERRYSGFAGEFDERLTRLMSD